ncbi:uncharacterized protein LOC126555088 [Aphis gossypii]|uniref:uncharacterized protein LOC126555088 n=1 Tax=Aphis gossypii TaxID=80765 RepID=UPI002158F805|nr:uncharacterized protein LOC126555088 [Aphis gossypii]
MESQQHLVDHDYILPIQNVAEAANDFADDNIQFWPIGDRPNSYKLIPSVHRKEEVIQDNLGYVYFRSKLTEKKIYLKCSETSNGCPATASISTMVEDSVFSLKRLHNHPLHSSDNKVRELRNVLGDKCVQRSARSYSARTLYAESIVSHTEGATNYTFIQAAERMRKIRKSVFPPTPKNLNNLNELLQLEKNKHFTVTFQAPESLFYQGPLLLPDGRFVGVLFSNINFIKTIQCELQNVKIAGCDGTFKTVPKTLDGDCYQLFTFQIIYKNVSFPLVYALLNGKTEEIYVALFKFVRQIVPLNYHNVTIITDFELAQMNAIKSIFKESDHQGCYFHFCQAVLRHLRSKEVGIYNLVKTNNIAARIFRMILALPYLPPDRNGQMPNMLDGFNAILICIVKYPEIADAFHSFLYNYVFGFWFVRIRPESFTVFNRTIRTNNYVESFHAALLKFIKPHPKIWEFIGGSVCLFVANKKFQTEKKS